MICAHCLLKRCGPRLLLAAILGLLVAPIQPAQAQTLTTLYSFRGGPADGCSPSGGLVRNSAGNLYGTTSICGTYNNGTVFELPKKGPEMPLYSFTGGTDGWYPNGGLARDSAGNLYGTTWEGGVVNSVCPVGCGVVFKVTPKGLETVLYSFTGGADGSTPNGGLVQDPGGNLYGTTLGGAHGYGNVFELTPPVSGGVPWNEKVIYTFTGGTDGSTPNGELVRDTTGNLYGTTVSGGDYNQGTVFKVSASGNEKVLYSFTGGEDGAQPLVGLIRDGHGNLYGTTWAGGDLNCGLGPPGGPWIGCGTVFEVTKKGVETVLSEFDFIAYPSRLVRDPHGNLYGAAWVGTCSNGNCGTLFELTFSGGAWAETTLYTFPVGGTYGALPSWEGLLLGPKGYLYGTTNEGGAYGYGTVFKLKP